MFHGSAGRWVVGFASGLACACCLCASPAPAASSAEPHEWFGSWRSEADGRTVFVVGRAGGDGSLRIVAAGAFEALGFHQGDAFLGLVRAIPANGSSWAQHGTVLRLRRSGTDTLVVAFAADLAGTSVKPDRWIRERPKGADARPPQQLREPTVRPESGSHLYVTELPEVIERVAPEYPAAIQGRGIQGTVLVQALVGTSGRVVDVKVTRSIAELDEYAMTAVRKWRFKPASSEGKPVEVWVAVPVRFAPP